MRVGIHGGHCHSLHTFNCMPSAGLSSSAPWRKPFRKRAKTVVCRFRLLRPSVKRQHNARQAQWLAQETEMVTMPKKK